MTWLLGFMSPRLWLALGLAGALALSHFTAYRSGRASVKAQLVVEALETSENNREAERLVNRVNAKVDDAYQVKLSAANAVAAGARTELARLRAAVAALPPVSEPAAASCGADAERDRTLRRLLAEGAELAREGGERVGALEAKLSGLRAYVVEVCGVLVTP